MLMWLEIGGEMRVEVRRFFEVVRNKMENFGEGVVATGESLVGVRAMVSVLMFNDVQRRSKSTYVKPTLTSTCLYFKPT